MKGVKMPFLLAYMKSCLAISSSGCSSRSRCVLKKKFRRLLGKWPRNWNFKFLKVGDFSFFFPPFSFPLCSHESFDKRSFASGAFWGSMKRSCYREFFCAVGVGAILKKPSFLGVFGLKWVSFDHNFFLIGFFANQNRSVL